MTRISVSSNSSDCDSEVEAEEVSELSEPEDENENVTLGINEPAFVADSVNSSLSNDIEVKGIINNIYDLMFTVRIMYQTIFYLVIKFLNHLTLYSF